MNRLSSAHLPGSRAVTFTLVILVAVAAWLLRVVPMFGDVFTNGFVNLQDPDAWYHLRLIENQTHNFPHRLLTDPYAADGGALVPLAPLFDFVVSLLAWVAGL